MQSISELLRAPGEAYAQAAQQVGQAQAGAAIARGQAGGGAAEQIGHAVGAIPQQMQQMQMQGLQRQNIQSEIADRNSQAAERAATLKKMQGVEAGNKAIDQIMQTSMEPDPETGVMTFKRQPFEQGVIQAGYGHQLPALAETLDKLDASAAKRNAEGRTMLAHSLIGVEQAGYTPESVLHAAAYLKANGLVTSDHLTPALAAMSSDGGTTPEAIKALVDDMGRNIPEYQALKTAETTRVAGLKKTAAETEKDLAEAAKAREEATHPKASEAELDQAAQALYAKKAAGQPLSPVEQASLTGYEARKRVVSDPAALAATQRQTNMIAAQVASQNRSQDFAEAQAGRKELTEKVEQPFQTAVGSANTLRDVVAAAKAGNKVAGSLQSLETTMAAIRAQGLNRINATEVGMTQNAGNLWDRIVGYVGKKAEGQPVPADIQKDMTDFAGILEKAAYKKYLEGHQSVTKRYKLSESPLPPPPGSEPVVPMALTPWLQGVANRK